MDVDAGGRGRARPRSIPAHGPMVRSPYLHRRALRRTAAARAVRRGRVGQIAASVLISMALIGGGTAVVGGVAVTTFLSEISSVLPEPHLLVEMKYPQPTIIYDRTGKVELGRFAQEDRRVVQFDEVPQLVLDATTTAEDRSFWDNSGYDPQAILAAIAQNVSASTQRGASTITQQLVRARLLPEGATDPGSDRYLRKVEEIIQAARVTQAFPGEAGKQVIITSYLNQIFYGHDAYGIAAAAKIYFGVSDLKKLTAAQAALLAGLPKSPTTLDPFKYAKADKQGKLVVPQDSPPVVRRNWILQGLSAARWTHLSQADIDAASREPVILSPPKPVIFKAPHFVWQVRDALVAQLGSLEEVETGGYRVITTLDWHDQKLAEKYITAAAIIPHLSIKAANKLDKEIGLSSSDRAWAEHLRGRGTHNGALVAIDYRTGDVLAYVGSAGYYRDDLKSKLFEPKFDVAGDGYRQPGSAFKPIVYATAFDKKVLDPGSLLVDVTTHFSRGWAPHDADQMERGPVLVRQALQFSLNIPAIRALQRVGSQAVASRAKTLGIKFAGGSKAFMQAGLAGAIGTVEVRPIDLTGAYGALANGGKLAPHRLVLEIDGPTGQPVFKAGAPKLVQTVSPQAAFLISSVIAGNTDPRQNPIWADVLAIRNGPHGQRRPAAAKTGTTNETRDFTTFGYLAPPKSPDQPGLVVGVWMGNSDHSEPKGREVTSLDGPSRVWQAFMRDASKKMPVASFHKPSGVVSARIDAFTGGKPGPWTRKTATEYFISGTQPGAKNAIDEPGLMYTQACGTWAVDLVKADPGPSSWDPDIRNWMTRAGGGAGRFGPEHTSTAYLFGRNSWGGPIAGHCAPPKPKDKGGGGGGQGDCNGHGHHCDPSPSPGPSPTPAPNPTPTPTPAPRRARPRGTASVRSPIALA
jgi:membrane peptidoglycan carboxypeptidase